MMDEREIQLMSDWMDTCETPSTWINRAKQGYVCELSLLQFTFLS